MSDSEPEKKPRKPRVVKLPQEKKEEDIKWNDLFFILSQAGQTFLRSLTKRDDIPEDAIDIIRGVIAIGEVADGCVAEGEAFTPVRALWWADTLKLWATNKTLNI